MPIISTTAAVILSIIGALGSAAGASISAITSAKNNQANIDAEWQRLMAQIDWERMQQGINLAWEREKAQNQYQWNVNDLKAAGLNPALMYQGYGGSPVAGTSTTNAKDGGGLTSAGLATNQNQVLLALIGGGLENVKSSLQILKTMQHTQAKEERQELLDAAAKYKTTAIQ